MIKQLLIQELGEALPDGGQLGGQVCPVCHGGSSKDQSLSIARKGDRILFICHRASCGAKGSIAAYGKPVAKEVRHRTFVTDPDPVPEEAVTFLNNKYYLTDAEIARAELGWTTRYSPAGKGRLYIPCFNQLGKPRGYVCRDLYKEQSPKALSFLFRDDDCKLAWYRKPGSKRIFLVEDNLSAIRASTYVTACALQGTHISDLMVDELRRAAPERVVLCLDRDATPQAIKQAVSLKGRLPVNVWPLTKDMKDTPRDVLEAMLTEG